MTLARHVGLALLGAVVLFVLTVKLGPFRDYQLATAAAYLCAAAGLTVLIGLNGQLSLGHGALMAVGAYTVAMVQHQVGDHGVTAQWTLLASLAAGVVAATLAGTVIGLAAARLRGPYLAGATLMLAVALPSLAAAYSGTLGGDQGLPVTITTPAWLGVTFPPTRWLAWICCAAALITLIVLANLDRSRIGRSWRAVRDNEVAASLAGLHVGRMRVLAFVISAACAGLGGALLATVQAIASPGAFTLTLSIGLLTAAIIGGLGSLIGSIWGSLIIVFLPTYAQNVATSHGLSSSISSNVPIAIYGVVLILVMLLFPSGIQGAIRRLLGPVTPAATAPFNALRRQAPASEHQKEGTS